MKKAILMLALFPFLHTTSYPVHYVSCKVDQMVVKYEDEDVQIHLFNTTINDQKGWADACSMMKHAKKLRIEIDPSSQVRTIIPVYLFADNALVQEELMKRKEAYPIIHNPKYTYEKRFEAAMDQNTAVMAKPVVKEEKRGHAMVAPLYLLATWIIWACMASYMWYHHKRKVHKNKEKGNVK